MASRTSELLGVKDPRLASVWLDDDVVTWLRELGCGGLSSWGFPTLFQGHFLA
jgi:hypothetical protein